jgi:hypothetical protein
MSNDEFRTAEIKNSPELRNSEVRYSAVCLELQAPLHGSPATPRAHKGPFMQKNNLVQLINDILGS